MASNTSVGPSAGVLLSKDSKACTLTDVELSEVLKVAGFPETVEVILPEAGDRADLPRSGWISFYAYPFRVGHAFPFSLLVQSVLRHFNLSPGQLMPHSWRVLRVLDEAMLKHDLSFDFVDLMHSFFLNPSGSGRFVLQLKPQRPALALGLKASDRGWNHKFFFVRIDSLGGVGADFLRPDWVSAGKLLLAVPPFAFQVACP